MTDTETRTDEIRAKNEASRDAAAARAADAERTEQGDPAAAQPPETGAATAVATPDEPQPLSTADLAVRDRTMTEAVGTERFARPEPAVTPAEAPATSAREPLFDQGAADELRGRWTEIQTGFVDEPRKSVVDADSLVADVMQRLADSFARERDGLERQWSEGDDASTEDLRVALRRYRSFFDRLLSM